MNKAGLQTYLWCVELRLRAGWTCGLYNTGWWRCIKLQLTEYLVRLDRWHRLLCFLFHRSLWFLAGKMPRKTNSVALRTCLSLSWYKFGEMV
jgi:hypothetical protein